MKIHTSKVWFVIIESLLSVVLLVCTYGHVFMGKECASIINTDLGIMFAIYGLYCSKSTIDGVSIAKNGDCHTKAPLNSIINDIQNNNISNLTNDVENAQPDPDK